MLLQHVLWWGMGNGHSWGSMDSWCCFGGSLGAGVALRWGECLQLTACFVGKQLPPVFLLQ